MRPHVQAFVDSLKFPEPEPPAEAMAPLPSEPPPRDEVHDEEPVRQRPAVRSILFAILLALATLGVAVYWWQRLTGTPSGVITSSERVTTPGATATPSDSREAEPPAAGAASPQGGDAGSADTSGASRRRKHRLVRTPLLRPMLRRRTLQQTRRPNPRPPRRRHRPLPA